MNVSTKDCLDISATAIKILHITLCLRRHFLKAWGWRKNKTTVVLKHHPKQNPVSKLEKLDPVKSQVLGMCTFSPSHSARATLQLLFWVPKSHKALQFKTQYAVTPDHNVLFNFKEEKNS